MTPFIPLFYVHIQQAYFNTFKIFVQNTLFSLYNEFI